MTASELRYTFTCPSCSGNFSILLDRIPPVQARFRCPHCKQPMDFPSRDEARVYASLQAATLQAAEPLPEPSKRTDSPPSAEPPLPPPLPFPSETEGGEPGPRSFRVEKPGFENDVFDRRAIRNLIRTGEVDERDMVRVDEEPPARAGDVKFLKSLFKLRESSTVVPPTRCRTHTDRVAFFKCNDSARPLCEECAPEKKFGAAMIRVCQHCGGTAQDLVPA